MQKGYSEQLRSFKMFKGSRRCKIFLYSYAFVLAIAVLYQTYISLKEYIDEVVIKTSTFQDQKHSLFPHLTICIQANDGVSKHWFFISPPFFLIFDLSKKAPYFDQEKLNLNNLTLDDVFKSDILMAEMGLSGIFETFNYTYLRHFTLNEKTQNTNMRFGSSELYINTVDVFRNISVIRKHPYFGYCHTMQCYDDSSIQEHGVYYMAIKTYVILQAKHFLKALNQNNSFSPENVGQNMPAYLFLHQPDSFWTTTSNTPGIRISQERIQFQVSLIIHR